MHVDEHVEYVNYLGREVPKKGFRAFIYCSDGKKRIAESWDEFELFTHSDTWFATKEEALTPKKEPEIVEQPKVEEKAEAKPEKVAPKNSRKKSEE